jgi:FKBP-type peptidyl-prolyl cis-trans isomerase FkpA/FKBP-type peptidyl-prolyl cis-trans isomerase FklB
MFKKLSTLALTLCLCSAVACGEEGKKEHDDHAGHDHAAEVKTDAPANPVDVAEKVMANEEMTSEQKASYGIGFSIGQQLGDLGNVVDFKALLKGIEDAAKGKDPKVSQEQFQTAFAALQSKLDAKDAESSKGNIEAGKKFMAENATKEGVKTTASGLQYKITKEGTGKTPTATSTVRAHYKGTLLDGTKFDSSYDRGEPIEIGLNQVVPGWTEGFQLLKEGAKATLWIPQDLGYGMRESGPIPAGSTLVFEVELLEVK